MAKPDMTITIDTSDIERDIQNFYDNLGYALGKETAEYLDEVAYRAIEKFYEDYPKSGNDISSLASELAGLRSEPMYYQRHYYNFEDKSHKPKYKNEGRHYFYGGVELNSDFMDELYTSWNGGRFPASTVFNYVYNGYHGNVGIPQMSPTPFKILEINTEKVERGQVKRIKTRAINYALGKSGQGRNFKPYNVLNFTKG